ncbi:MAG: type I-E CRISPR-associated protein Cas5/CasD [Chthoniobacterales bacterium]
MLDAPMQSWGTSSRFQRRGTDPVPSKSGVLGLVAAALGIDKDAPDEPERLAPLAALGFSVHRFPRLRAGQPLPILRLTDYHTVGGGYHGDTDRWARLSIPRKASGGPFGTVLTQREYLTDAVFAAVLQGPRGLLENIEAALRDPVWGVWLGRKSCVPATPVHAILANDLTVALARLAELVQNSFPSGAPLPWTLAPAVPLVRDLTSEESNAPQDGADTRTDQPLSYGRRLHATRTIRG